MKEVEELETAGDRLFTIVASLSVVNGSKPLRDELEACARSTYRGATALSEAENELKDAHQRLNESEAKLKSAEGLAKDLDHANTCLCQRLNHVEFQLKQREARIKHLEHQLNKAEDRYQVTIAGFDGEWVKSEGRVKDLEAELERLKQSNMWRPDGSPVTGRDLGDETDEVKA